jgi:hypothetical protein
MHLCARSHCPVQLLALLLLATVLSVSLQGKLVGQGSFGSVYLGIDLHTGKEVRSSSTTGFGLQDMQQQLQQCSHAYTRRALCSGTAAVLSLNSAHSVCN